MIVGRYHEVRPGSRCLRRRRRFAVGADRTVHPRAVFRRGVPHADDHDEGIGDGRRCRYRDSDSRQTILQDPSEGPLDVPWHRDRQHRILHNMLLHGAADGIAVHCFRAAVHSTMLRGGHERIPLQRKDDRIQDAGTCACVHRMRVHRRDQRGYQHRDSLRHPVRSGICDVLHIREVRTGEIRSADRGVLHLPDIHPMPASVRRPPRDHRSLRGYGCHSQHPRTGAYLHRPPLLSLHRGAEEDGCGKGLDHSIRGAHGRHNAQHTDRRRVRIHQHPGDTADPRFDNTPQPEGRRLRAERIWPSACYPRPSLSFRPSSCSAGCSSP